MSTSSSYYTSVNSTSPSDLRITSEFVSVLDDNRTQDATQQTVCHSVKTNNFYGYINILLDYMSLAYNYRYNKMLHLPVSVCKFGA